MRSDVLIVGGGGREHALAWKLAQSPKVGQIYVAPGNGGTGTLAQNVPIKATDINALVGFALNTKIGLTVVGPDDPLALGIVDAFQAEGLRIFGPTRAAARIEGSKAFAKHLMRKEGIPTAHFRVFTTYPTALAHVWKRAMPVVIKASGLALGKGVHICRTREEAERALLDVMLSRIHGLAGDSVVIEEFLDGPEFSVHALCDGTSYTVFPLSQDHKAIFDRDRGPNTGGMGAIAPLPLATAEMLNEVRANIVRPAILGMDSRGKPFTGCLYPGIKLSPRGLCVLEYNARFGDPETQVYMRLLKTDLFDLLEACVDGCLGKMNVEWHSGVYAACVVLASRGYPNSYEKGLPISGLKEADQVLGVTVFHAGTTATGEGRFITSGGRVLGVTALALSSDQALSQAYEAVRCIHFDGMQYRTDIGARAMEIN